MEHQIQTSSTPSFSMSDFNAADTAKMEIMLFGRRTGWFWEFAGPGHAKTIAYNDARARERLEEDARREQQMVNGKKYKATVESVEDVKARNINAVVSRLVGWNDVEMDGQIFPFSPDNARRFLEDPARGAILVEALEFLFEASSFMKRSQTN